jgi:protein-arginine kinase activator protein McsA
MAGTKRSRAKKQVFSVTKAVKANARTRVGQPPPAFVLPDDTKTARSARKYKKSLQDLIEKEE